jgi:hypothetical protein
VPVFVPDGQPDYPVQDQQPDSGRHHCRDNQEEEVQRSEDVDHLRSPGYAQD